MKTLSLLVMTLALVFNAAHALTISGQAPAGAKTVAAYLEFSATKKIPVKCMHYNILGPIFNNGERNGWNINHDHAHGEATVDENGNYSMEIDFKELATSFCHFTVDSLSISTGSTIARQVFLVPSKDATETVFNFDLLQPNSWSNVSEMADVRYNSVFEVNFR